MVELGPTMLPVQFHVSSSMGEFICFARGLILKGTVLAGDLVSNGPEWILVQGTAQDLSQAEEMSAFTLYNMVPHSPDAKLERLSRFREAGLWVLWLVKVAVGITAMLMRMPCILRTLKRVPVRVTGMMKRTTPSEVVCLMKVKAGPMHPSSPARAPITT